MVKILGAGSPLNKFELIEIELTRNSKTVYVELTGNDLTGDGSQGKPFKTVARAMLEAVGTISMLFVSLGVGEHVSDAVSVSNYILHFVGVGKLKLSQGLGQALVIVDRGGQVLLDVEIIDASTGAYAAAFIVGNGSIHVWANVTLTNAVNLLVNAHGNNAFIAQGCTISSSGAIGKIAASVNNEAISLYESSVTYTNIT